MTEQRDSAVTAAELDAMRVYAHEATMAITGLVGGGSECFGREMNGIFTADLPYCVGRIRDRIDASAERELNARRDLVALRRERDDLQRMYAAMCAQGREQIAMKDAALREARDEIIAHARTSEIEDDGESVIALIEAALAPAAQGEKGINSNDTPAPAPSAGETVNEQMRAQLVRTGEAWENLSTLPSAPSNVQGSARIFADEIKALLAAAPPTRAAIIEECAKVAELQGSDHDTCIEIAAAIRALLSHREKLCDDEGCPHHGTSHVCISGATVVRDALTQAKGALLLDTMVDDTGKPFGTTEVALKAIVEALAALAAAAPTTGEPT